MIQREHLDLARATLDIVQVSLHNSCIPAGRSRLNAGRNVNQEQGKVLGQHENHLSFLLLEWDMGLFLRLVSFFFGLEKFPNQAIFGGMQKIGFLSSSSRWDRHRLVSCCA